MGKQEEKAYTEHFERMQKKEGRERAQVTVFRKSTDLIVPSIVSSCSIGIQNKRPENENDDGHFTTQRCKLQYSCSSL